MAQSGIEIRIIRIPVAVVLLKYASLLAEAYGSGRLVRISPPIAPQAVL